MKQSFMILSYTRNDKQVKEIDKFLDLLERSGVCKVIENHFKTEKTADKGGRPNYNPYNMLAMILYSFAFSFASLREIEDRCVNDLRYVYIMDGEKPAFKTIGNFINQVILPNIDKIFSLITLQIIKDCNLNFDTVFIDGSKFEAKANRYKFVWKPTTFHKRLSDKEKAILDANNIEYSSNDDELLSSSELAKAIIKLSDYMFDSNLMPDVTNNYKMAYDSLVDCFVKGVEYEQKERICGPNRKSYYKTDHDATAMTMKAEYYAGLGSSMKAGYNVQISVSNGLITTCYLSQSRADINDFIPTLQKHYELYGFYPKFVCADAGYGSLANYEFMKNNGMQNYVKYFTWEGEVSGKNPHQYILQTDGTIICLNRIVGYKMDVAPYHPKKPNSIFYKIEGCADCPFASYCKRFMKNKKENFKFFEVQEKLQTHINESEANLLSPKGIELRVNRSCQVEGAFGNIKENMRYVRFRRITMEKVDLEFKLTALGLNIRKLFRYYKGQNPFVYWTMPENLEPEKKKKPSAKRLSKRASKVKKKSVNEIARKGYKY